MYFSAAALERLLAALRGAAYEVTFTQEREVCLLTIGEAEGEPERFRARLFDIEEDGDEAEVGSIDTWFDPIVLPALEGDQQPLALGYAAGPDLFVGWPAYDAVEEWKRRRFPTPYRALREAEETGWAAPLTTSEAYVFSPQRVGEFLVLHRRVWGEREVLRRRWTTQRQKPVVARKFLPSGIFYEDLSHAAMGMEVRIDAEAATPPPARKVVETGFSTPGRPEALLPKWMPLEPGGEYLFCFAIGEELQNTIDEVPAPPPEGVEGGDRLAVVLFPFENEMEIPGRTRGEMELLDDGSAIVAEPALVPRAVEDTLRDRVLFFAVAAPEREGEMRLRCNLYLGSTLLQSRLVGCQVGGKPRPDRQALATKLDYSLASVLDRERLANVPQHDFSLMVNGGSPSAAPTHQFRFYGDGDRSMKGSASLPAAKIEKAISVARGQLRKASWSKDAEWKEGDSYRYASSPVAPEVFHHDLVELAIRGARLFANIASELALEIGGVDALEAALRRPGRIQIASPEGGMYLPAGLFYDHPVERTPSNPTREAMRVCDSFLADAEGGFPLDESSCMNGDCPNHADRLVVCPSGFWGFRHEIGWPVAGEEPTKEVEIHGSKAEMAIGVSTDPKLELRSEHIPRVLALGTGKVAESRDEFAALATSMDSHLVYFYCHGGYADPEPFLELGPVESDGLDRGYLREKKIRWAGPLRPLVFINGCRTTQLDPESLGGLLDGFVKDANAVGVIGTEITVFEQLACRFGLVALENFLDGSMTIGGAIRRARLDLLRERNPLGLVYVPFVAADTKLVKRGA